MSHDETSGPVTRKERRAAYGGKRQAAPRYVFSAAAHIREDWLPEDLIDLLESRARGYNGILRQVLCTAAATLRQQEVALTGYRAEAIGDMLKSEEREPLDEMRNTPVPEAPIAPLNLSKRNQQPGRLSGGEREALKKFVAFALMATDSDVHKEEVTTMGRKMLANVRKRALGGDLVEETVDCSALMPVGVEDDGS